MATAAIPTPTRSVTEKFTRVPNSFIENQHLFKLGASRSLALITFRRDQDPNFRNEISDLNWSNWTGLGPRAKELAIKELSGFGMQMEGRGDRARFSWDWNRWNEAIKTKHQGEYDAKRKDREARAVPAKAGAKVHEECADQGCAMLRAGQCAGTNESIVNDTKSTSGLFITQVTQPVTQTVELAWLQTMAVLCSFFPLLIGKVGAAFLGRLLQVVRGVFPSITDQELAEAVRIAYTPTQYHEKLFLLTVPNTIAKLRREKRALERPQVDGSDLPVLLPEEQIAGLRDTGPPKKKRAVDYI